MSNSSGEYPYPRRQFSRKLMHWLSTGAFKTLSHLEIVGRENIPSEGPLIVVANHFSFLDPALMVGLTPWPMEFLGGFQTPNAPPVVRFIPKMWGYFKVFRGTGSRGALRAAEAVLLQRGVLGIYPEGGSWATVLRPARPGTAYIASRSGAILLPIGVDGLPRLFPRIRSGHRAKVTVRIGEPFGPYQVTGRGRERRKQLDAIGHEIMQRIAELLPQESRGHFSDDPAIRAAARGTEVFPWNSHPEGA